MLSLKSGLSALLTLFLLGQSVAAHAELPDFTTLVEAAAPAVVNISTTQKVPDQVAGSAQSAIPDLEGLPPGFREFFERNLPQQQPRSPQGRQQQRGAQSL